jgi:putative serine protease PepD
MSDTGSAGPTPPASYPPPAQYSSQAPYTPDAAYAPPSAPQPTPYAQLPTPTPAPRRRVGGLLGGLIGGLIGAGLVAGAVYAFPPTTKLITPTQSESGTITIATDGTAQPIEAVAAKVTPSVVNVAIAQTGVNPYTGAHVTQTVGNGSGVVIRADGYILTNNHVVQNADSIVVRIGTEDLVATVVGTDPSTDLAVIKVAKTGLRPAEIGTSTTLKVGETVVAVGSPFGLDKTVTSGIISALHRTNLASDGGSIARYTNLIQTDASINPGNSGGALCDLRGRVVGINTLIQTGGAQQSAGIGFAIPIDFAKGVADQLIATGRAEHPFLGVSMATVDADVASQMGLPSGTVGSLIQEIIAGSPAEKAGLKVGDVIVEMGGEAVTSVEDAFAAIRSGAIGKPIDVTVLRAGSRTTVTVTLGSDRSAP